MNPRHPVYIISKGRWESRLTSKALERIGVPYSIVVEPQEYEQYSSVISSDKILTLPFSNLGKGSIPARNWVWEHAEGLGAKAHWILDDNIRGFFRFNKNLIIPVTAGNIFYAAEEFCDRYENIAQAGFQYFMFISRKTLIPPYYRNTRIYSCILNFHNHPHRWRGRYNEDTDLSLRILKDFDNNLCTVLFNAFVADKMQTMTMKGGNTDKLYSDEDSRLKMTQSLIDQHPDCVKKTWKFGHWHHQVDYSFAKKKKFVFKPGREPVDKINNFGMVYQENIGGEWIPKLNSQSKRNEKDSQTEEADIPTNSLSGEQASIFERGSMMMDP